MIVKEEFYRRSCPKPHRALVELRYAYESTENPNEMIVTCHCPIHEGQISRYKCNGEQEPGVPCLYLQNYPRRVQE
jgi:hypothetical protein